MAQQHQHSLPLHTPSSGPLPFLPRLSVNGGGGGGAGGGLPQRQGLSSLGLPPLAPQGAPSLGQQPQPQQPTTSLGALSMLSPQTLQLLQQHQAMPPQQGMPPQPR